MRFSAHLSLLFRELPYLERPRAAAEAGFSAVETWWPGDEQAVPWAQEVTRLGLHVASVNADGGDVEAGERGFLNVEGRYEANLDVAHRAVALAESCGAPCLNVLVGRDTGEPRDAQLGRAAALLAEFADLAAEASVMIVVEPINELDVPGYLVPTPRAALELIDAAGRPNVRLLYDAYHAARAGGDPVRDVGALVPRIGHVQYADCPGRGAPGTGQVDLAAFVAALEAAGYQGPVGLEFDPRGPTADALASIPA